MCYPSDTPAWVLYVTNSDSSEQFFFLSALSHLHLPKASTWLVFLRPVTALVYTTDKRLPAPGDPSESFLYLYLW
jgi:hypothetical protein